MRILVLGSNGQLGSCLQDQLDAEYYDVFFASRSDIDVTDNDSLISNFLKIKPNIVINSSAYTDVDGAESNKESAYQTNHIAVKNIATQCKTHNSHLIHISTDYVFDGTINRPYKEEDTTSPNSIYGSSKLMGEDEIKKSGCKFIIIRTSWVFSEYGSNFLKTMMHLASKKNSLNIVSDQVGCPTYAQDIAIAISKILKDIILSPNISGIYNFCGDRPCSWFEFANSIFLQADVRKFKVPETVNSILTKQFPTPANRPKYSVLDCAKIKKDFGIKPSNWELGISAALKNIKNNT